jgi:hypothetical protein
MNMRTRRGIPSFLAFAAVAVDFDDVLMLAARYTVQCVP